METISPLSRSRSSSRTGGLEQFSGEYTDWRDFSSDAGGNWRKKAKREVWTDLSGIERMRYDPAPLTPSVRLGGEGNGFET